MRKLLIITCLAWAVGCGGDDSSSNETDLDSVDATVSEDSGETAEETESGDEAGEETPTTDEGGSESTETEEGGSESATEGAGTESSTTESGDESTETANDEGDESIFVEGGGQEEEGGEAPEDALAAFGEACVYSDVCGPEIEDENGELIENPDWPDCLSAQCESGICSFPACTKFCETDEDCGDAADGPYGTQWACAVTSVTLTNKEIKQCRPGTTFSECASNSDCPEGETCQIDYLNGDYGNYCLAAIVDGAKIGEPCNSDPRYGDVQYCENGMCGGIGCLGMCASDDDCGDNPYFACRDDYFYSDLNQKFEYCYPRACDLEADCADIEGAYCRVLLAYDQEVSEKEKYWDHACWPADEGDLVPGEACSNEEGATECVNGFMCINERCSTTCNSDADCPAEDMTCEVIEYSVDDFSFDFPLNVCVFTEGSKTACVKEQDCGEGESCKAIQLEIGPFDYSFGGQCEAADPSYGVTGDVCDADNPCQSGLCLNYTVGPSRCTAHCQEAADCAPILDENGAELSGFCTSFAWQTVGTKSELDDFYLPLCYFEEGSGDDCSADFTCGEGEACGPSVITVLPSDIPSITWSCSASSESANALPGEDCESASDCASGLCILPSWGTDPGYCSAFCSDEVACPEAGEESEVFECEDYVLIEREENVNSAVVGRCERP